LVEGSELAVLETVDWKHGPRIGVLMVEAKNNQNPGGNSTQNWRVQRLLEGHGYRLEPRDTVRRSNVYVRID
jgi:hypothetical protein